MQKEKNKSFAKKSILCSIILFIICTPLLFGATLNFFYYRPKNENSILDSFFKVIQNLILEFGHNYEFIQWLLSISPAPSAESIFTVGNVFTLLLLIGFLSVFFLFRHGVNAIGELAEAKKNARKKRLENEY